MNDILKDGSADWHNWMRDTMQIDPSDTKSIALVWAVIGKMKADEMLAEHPKPAPVQSAEELLCLIRGREKCGEDAEDLIKADRAAQRQAGREERCDNCDRDSAINAFRMDELDAVMLSNDKWLDGPALKNNPATRAADAREIALKAIEKERARADKLDQRYAALVEAARKISQWVDANEGTPFALLDIVSLIDKALSDLDKTKETTHAAD